MVDWLTRGHLIVVATSTGADYIIMVHNIDGEECHCTVAGLTNRVNAYVIHRSPGGINPVVAIHTCASYEVVVEVYRLPSQVRVAIGTFILYLNMVHRLSGCYDIVVAIAAEAEDLVVVHSRHCLPILSVVAGIASLAGVNVIDRFSSGVDATVDTVASDAFGGGTGKLASGMTALAGNKIVTPGQFEAGFGVVEGFFLAERVSPAAE